MEVAETGMRTEAAPPSFSMAMQQNSTYAIQDPTFTSPTQGTPSYVNALPQGSPPYYQAPPYTVPVSPYPQPPPYTTATGSPNQVQFSVNGQPAMQSNVSTNQVFVTQQYGYPMAGTVYTAQPQQTVVVVQTAQRSDHIHVNDLLGLSIFTFLCCDWILGIAAIIISLKVRECNAKNDEAGARYYFKVTLALNLISIITSVVIVSAILGAVFG